jgi:hypothetical protein
VQIETYGIYAHSGARFVENGDPDYTTDVDLECAQSVEAAWQNAIQWLRKQVMAHYPPEDYGYWLVALRYWQDDGQDSDGDEEWVELGRRRLFPEEPLPECIVTALLPPEDQASDNHHVHPSNDVE